MTGPTPLRLYLDSSDYSVLSDPKRAELDAPGVLSSLRKYIDGGKVECFFSGAHLSEMAPVDKAYTDAAERRASLMVELCGKNVFVSHNRLMSHEVRRALGMKAPQFDPVRRDGEWFPEGAAEMLPISEVDRTTSMQEVIQELGRAARRKATKALMKRGKQKRSTQQSLINNARSGSLDEILSIYPMKPESARILSRFVAGDATAAEATEAFQDSLRDPRWMMKWFGQHHDKLTPFIAWLRGPAQDVVGKLDELARSIAAARESLSPDQFAELFVVKQWKEWQDDMVAQIANRFAAKTHSTKTLTTDQVDNCCPGLSVAVRSIHSAWRTVTLTQPRQAKLSDFPDAMHAAYAPYSDIYRADSFMAPYIAHQTSRHGTTVVPKLTALPQAIESLLAKRRER